MSPELEWVAATVASPGGPAVLVWYEPATDLIIDTRVIDPSLPGLAEWFTYATEQPNAGEPRRPSRIRVADERLAAALRQIPGLEVVVGDISDARDMLAELGAEVAQLELEPELPLEVWVRFFAAAAAFYRAHPWDAIPSDAWIQVDCERLGITEGALTVVGQHGTAYGLTLLRSVEDAALWIEAGERRERGEPATFPHQFFMLGFNDEDELDPDEVAAIASKGWDVVNRAAYPSVTVLDEELDGRLPTVDEMTGIIAVLEAVTALVGDEPDLADAWDGEPIEWQGELQGGRVRLAAPLEMEDDSLMSRLAAREDVPDDVLAAAEMLVEFAAAYHSAAFETIRAGELEALLLETIPAQLAIESNEAPRILRAARELLDVAGNAAARAIVDAALEQRMVRELENPQNFSTGKQLVMAGIAAGYDMSTEQGVTEFVEAFARAQRPPRASKSKGSAKAKAKISAKAKPKASAKAKAKAKPEASAKVKAKPTAGTKSKARKTPGAKARKR